MISHTIGVRETFLGHWTFWFRNQIAIVWNTSGKWKNYGFANANGTQASSQFVVFRNYMKLSRFTRLISFVRPPSNGSHEIWFVYASRWNDTHEKRNLNHRFNGHDGRWLGLPLISLWVIVAPHLQQLKIIWREAVVPNWKTISEHIQLMPAAT